jgi:ferredoxin-type protein NapH
MLKISRLRRVILLGIILLFLLQFLNMNLLVGGLTGSVAVFYVKFLDIYAYLESLVSSKDFTTKAILSVLPIVMIYVIFGRAFCGWVCPMDFIFALANRIRSKASHELNLSPSIGYGIAIAFIIISAIAGIPIFTNYLSHLTNFFRVISTGVYLGLDFPADPSTLYFSAGILISLIVLELIYPRLWCRVLCPLGKIYGLFNKISLLRLKFVEGQCGECNLCEDVCYMRVRMTPYLDQPSLRDTECIYCGNCVEGCGTKGRLIKLSLNPFIGKR